MKLPAALAAEVAALEARYGPAAHIEAPLPDGLFDPFTKTDRVGEVCMVIRRPTGRLLTFRKDIYPPGVMRLLTGGIGHGEQIEAALHREVAEETSLQVAIRRLLAIIAYSTPGRPAGSHAFYTFAFLLDETGGKLLPQDPEERIEAFGQVAPSELEGLATVLAGLPDRQDRAIGGSWRTWGLFRAVVHRVVAAQLVG